MAENSSSNCTQILFLGDGAVGKTSLIQRFLYDSFKEVHRSTVEDIYHRNYLINDIHSLQVEMIDTSGTFIFPEMRRLRITKATGFILVMSLTDFKSFECLQDILKQIRELRSPSSGTERSLPPLTIAANKLDCSLDREISDEVLSHWLKSEGLESDQLVFTSAKHDDGIWTIFASLWQQYASTFKQVPQLQSGSTSPLIHNGTSTANYQPTTNILSRLRRFSAYAVLVDPNSPLLLGSKTLGNVPTTTTNLGACSAPIDNGLMSSTDQSAARSKMKKSLPRRSVGPIGYHNTPMGHVFHVDCVIS